MNKYKIIWFPFFKMRKSYNGNLIGAFQIIRIGACFNFDYIFFDFLFWTIRIKRTYKKMNDEK